MENVISELEGLRRELTYGSIVLINLSNENDVFVTGDGFIKDSVFTICELLFD